MFQAPVPGFNIAGKTGVGTLLGSLCSLLLIIIMTLYGLIKLDQLVNKIDPTITTVSEKQAFGDEIMPINLRDETNMRFAFSIADRNDAETLIDPRYVKVIARVFTNNFNGTNVEHVVELKPCTDDDWAQFSPPDE